MISILRQMRVAAAIFAISLAAAAPALAHSDVHLSDPPDGAVLRAAPSAIVLRFQEPVRVMTLRLLDGAGQERRLAREGTRTAVVREARASVQDRLAPGDYRVEWRGASEDGHVGGGAVRFRVEPDVR